MKTYKGIGGKVSIDDNNRIHLTSLLFFRETCEFNDIKSAVFVEPELLENGAIFIKTLKNTYTVNFTKGKRDLFWELYQTIHSRCDLINKNFKPTKEFWRCISFDDVHKVFQYYSSPYYYCQKYDNILDFDLVENGHETVNDITVIIRMNDPEIPTIQLKIFDGSIERSSDNYSKYIKKAQNIISYLTIITNNRDTINSNRVTNDSTSSIDEIRQYKQLLDEGIISQQEFDAKKKQLLNL